MLPAISADLPAYVASPRGEVGRSDAEPGFGPATRVSLSTDRAIQAQSQRPGEGLYGPDGKFVETANRRDITKEQRERSGERNSEKSDESGGDRSTRETEAKRASSADAAGTQRRTSPSSDRASRDRTSPDPQTRENETPPRDLSLAEVDAAIPPAEREELRELADRAARDGGDALSARDYKRLARLMERVGRYPDALRALERARELDEAMSSGA